jgi:hypothetical protein
MALGLIGGTIDHAKRLIGLYRTAGRDAGHPDEPLIVAITSHFYVGDTQEQALHNFFPYYHRYLSPDTNGGRSFYVDRPTMTSLAARGGPLMAAGHWSARSAPAWTAKPPDSRSWTAPGTSSTP